MAYMDLLFFKRFPLIAVWILEHQPRSRMYGNRNINEDDYSRINKSESENKTRRAMNYPQDNQTDFRLRRDRRIFKMCNNTAR